MSNRLILSVDKTTKLPPAATVNALKVAIAGTSAIDGAVPVFIQATRPDYTGAFEWWDTSGGNLTLWIEDGLV